MDILLRGNTLCVRDRDGTYSEIIDSVCFYLIANHYVYIECRRGYSLYLDDNDTQDSVSSNTNSIMCLLFNMNDYIQTGNITILSISNYVNSRPFNVDNYGIDMNNLITWNQIWNQELYF